MWAQSRISSRLMAAAGFVIGSNVICALRANAHIKWFFAYDVAGQPRPLETLLSPDFELLIGWALLLLLSGHALESSRLGLAFLRALNGVTTWLRSDTELLIRAGCAFFFIALWTKGGVILTPELATSLQLVPWLQLGIAAGLIWRRTLPVSALGIAILYMLAVHNYGIFHLLDYPIFLGLAVYLALVGLHRDFFGVRPLDILRWSTAVTLMWASIEKWAYPQWTFPLFLTRPELTMGFNPEFFMRAAGVVEFSLAFALLLTPLVRRVAAAVLCCLFLAAVPEFGKVDAIGHAPIIVILLAIIGDELVGHRFLRTPSSVKADLERPNDPPARWNLVLFPIGYSLTLAGFLAFYYILHAALFGTPLT